MKLRDYVWLWGQTMGGHHCDAYKNIPGVNHMGPAECARTFDIPNVCRVALSSDANIFTEEEASSLDFCRQTVWSALGAGTTNNASSAAAIGALRANHPNIVGAVLDDFFNDTRMELYPPEELRKIRDMLAPLSLWGVIYEYELTESRRAHLSVLDVISFWTWRSENLVSLDDNLKTLADLMDNKKPIMQGVYLYDYGNDKQLPDDYMYAQLAAARRLLHEGTTSGIIVCSNTVADLGLSAAEIFFDWLGRYGDEEI